MKQKGHEGRGRGTEGTGATVAFGTSKRGPLGYMRVLGLDTAPKTGPQKQTYTEGEVTVYPSCEAAPAALGKNYDGYRITWTASQGFRKVTNDGSMQRWINLEEQNRFRIDLALAALDNSEAARQLQGILEQHPELKI